MPRTLRFFLDDEMTDEKTYSYDSMRADCYKLLAVCFYQPEKELFAAEKVFENLSGLLQEVSPEAQTHSIKMRALFEKTDDQDLAVDYAALFVGPFELAAPPYGSVYLEDSRQVMGQTTIDTMESYREAGLTVDIKEPADHIAIELEFMHYLILSEVEAKTNGDDRTLRSMHEIRNAFLKNFLGKWVSDFCDAIKKGTNDGYYSSLADCLRTFISIEQNLPNGMNHRTTNTVISTLDLTDADDSC